MELNEAYDILSDRDKRARYDEIIGVARPSGGSTASPGDTTRSAEEPYGEAGPPPINPDPVGSVLTFGRYRGWSLNQVERYDRDYIEWLSRTTMGRNYRLELEQLLKRRG
jgi:curved DNA-binding protein CbpA